MNGAKEYNNPLLGTWRLNVGKCTYSPGPPPKSQTICFERVDNGLKVSTTVYEADGSTTLTHYVAMYDGAFHPVTGLDGVDMIRMYRIDELTDGRIDRRNGVVNGHRLRTVAADRQSYSVLGSGTRATGVAFTYTLHYDKISEPPA